ncbi:hypothetical protein [Paraflavitalea pollutisoli]|uniref:hypothetical protein n=1 Tax=Paraflavitalea pollutisoli TaxID=3034143 RepID=UPI0023EB7F60|nr:hypothetical protein [Paraflavitalea sp. H1-2-19X]
MNTRDQAAVAFYEAYRAAARRLDIFHLHESIGNLIKHYKRLAVQCLEEGYGDYLSEFDHDILIRGMIEKVLTAPELQGFDAFKDFQQNIADIDGLLQESFIPGFTSPIEGPWWQRGVVRKGYLDYAEDVKTHFGIDLANYQ